MKRRETGGNRGTSLVTQSNSVRVRFEFRTGRDPVTPENVDREIQNKGGFR
jgi:hypothetical protein